GGGRFIAEEDPDLLQTRHYAVERLDLLDADVDALGPLLGADPDDHRAPGLEEIAILAQAFREKNGFVRARRIGELHHAHAVPGTDAAFLAGGDRAGKAPGGSPAADRLGELRPALHPHLLQDGPVLVERMGRQAETDRVV